MNSKARSKAPEAGNLDGIRGRPRVSSDEAVEQMYASIEGLKGMGFNEGLIRDVVLAGELGEVLKTDALVARLVSRCETILAGSQNAWSACLDPGDKDMRKIHLEARAAQIVIDWVIEIYTAGQMAEQTIEDEETSNE